MGFTELILLPHFYSDLKVTLVGVEYYWFLSVELPLHFQSQTADCWLEICLLCIHHEPDTICHSMLENTQTHTHLRNLYFICSWCISTLFLVVIKAHLG